MLHKSLSTWLTDSNGIKFEEHGFRIIDDATAECWIPSDEGSKFRIKWAPVGETRPKLGLRCDVRLDGVDITSRVLSAKSIAANIPGDKDGMSVAPGIKRPLVFGRRNITDQDELASSKSATQEELGTIRVELTWVRCTQTKRLHEYYDPKAPGRLHERDAKKGHGTAAMLGDPIATGDKPPRYAIKTRSSSSPVIFIFRYGPRDWLKAKDIIPSKPVTAIAYCSQNQCFSSTNYSAAKRKREPSPISTIKRSQSDEKRIHISDPSGVIDIDDLESDSDSDIVVLSDSIASILGPPV